MPVAKNSAIASMERVAECTPLDSYWYLIVVRGHDLPAPVAGVVVHFV